jgi:nucleoid-associated protein YgaU
MLSINYNITLPYFEGKNIRFYSMIKHALGYLIILLLSLSSTYALSDEGQDQPALKADHPSSYTVVSGDTLWAIAGKFLKDPWRWKEVWQNNSQIANPDLIYPGDTIRLIMVNGKPQLTLNADETSVLSNNTRSARANTDNSSLKTIKLSPKIYVSTIRTAIPAIPLERINSFLLRNRVVDASLLTSAPHVLAGQEERVIMGAGDTIYARGDFPNTIASYGLYRKGQDYIDPETEEVLGAQAINVGAVNLRGLSGDTGTFTITRSTNEVRIGDRLLPSEERQISSTFIPTPPKNTVLGRIMNVETGVSQAGRLDIIAINLGRRESLEQGDILGIYKDGAKIRDRNAQKKTPRTITLPDERAGLVMVFQVFEKMSLAIVLEAERGVVLQDIVSNP